MFKDSLQNDRNLGINFWEMELPATEVVAFTIPGRDKTKGLFWEAHPCAVDCYQGGRFGYSELKEAVIRPARTFPSARKLKG